MKCDDPTKKKQGEHILQNYKRQLAERQVRERYEKGELKEGELDGKDSLA